MSGNMPVLWQNALLQYQTCPIAAKAWVWFAETRGAGMQYAADNYANEVKQLVVCLRPVQSYAQKGHPSASDEVMGDLLKRQCEPPRQLASRRQRNPGVFEMTRAIATIIAALLFAFLMAWAAHIVVSGRVI